MRITVKDLINVLSKLPEDVKDKTIASITGGSDAGVRVYQLELEGEKHKRYILVPANKEDAVYDSYGKRKVEEEKISDWRQNMVVYDFETDKKHFTCKSMIDGKVISKCTLSINVNESDWEVTWEVSYWKTCDGYKHLGYGRASMGNALQKAVEIYGVPEHIHYIWNGANGYVLEWMEKHFDAKCSCPLAVQKTQAEDDRESHIYILNREKVFEYFSIKTEQ